MARLRRRAPAKERLGIVDRSLVAHARVSEGGERGLRIAPGSEAEGVEAAARELQQVVAADVAEGAKLSAVAQAPANQRAGGVAAPVGEFRKADRDQRQRVKVFGERQRIVVGCEPDADGRGARE